MVMKGHGASGAGDKLRLRDEHVHTAIFKQITIKDLP